jgi:hypothetical protein
VQSKHFLLIVIVLGVVDGLIVGALVGVVAGPTAGVVVGLAAALAPVLLVPAVVALMLPITGWSALARLYPQTASSIDAPGSGGDRGRLISLAIRSRGLRLNRCVRGRADDDHLHLSLVVPTFRRVPGISLPWSAVESVELSGRVAELRLFEGPTIWAPRSLAEQEASVRRAIDESTSETPARLS